MRLLATLIALVSFNTFACPQLAGNYSYCRSTTGAAPEVSDMVITQKSENGVTVYTMASTDVEDQERSSHDYYADGKPRVITSESEMGEITDSMTFTCKGKELKSRQYLSIAEEMFFDVNIDYKKNGQELMIKYKGTVAGIEFEDTLNCN